MAPSSLTLDEIERRLSDESVSIVDRMKALFFARFHENEEAIRVLQLGFKHDSVLLRHEIAYILGQLKLPEANDVLVKLVEDEKEHAMVRHEAAEALAAIGSEESVTVLERYLEDPCIPLKETCELAVQSIKAKKAKEGTAVEEARPEVSHYLYTSEKPFFTEDPVPRTRKISTEEELGKVLLDQTASLYDRYDSLFALRNLATPEAIRYVNQSLQDDKTSALFRHEVAFVIGQLHDPSSLDVLVNSVASETEHCMTRHEAAMALGSVGVEESCRQAALDCLRKYADHKSKIVAESCMVAIDNIIEE